MASGFRKLISHSIASLIGVTSTLAILQTNNNSHESNEEKRSLLKSGDGAGTHNHDPSLTHVNLQPNQNNTSALLPIIQSPISTFQPNPKLQIAYDARSKNPIYVLERLHASDFKSRGQIAKDQAAQIEDEGKEETHSTSTTTRFHFLEPKSLSPQHRSRNAYYRNSGYDRGHLAPAADYKYNSKYKQDTYTLANISPQYPVLNRRVWLRLEEWVRRFVVKDNTDGPINDDGDDDDNKVVYVITGPMWLPSSISPSKTKINSRQYDEKDNNQNNAHSNTHLFQYSFQGIGTPPMLIKVPTHFFKIIFTMNKNEKRMSTKTNDDENVEIDDSYRKERLCETPARLSLASVDNFAAFVIPNKEYIDDYKRINRNDDILLSDFMVRIGDIEAVTGLSFFSTDPTALEVFDLITDLHWCNDDNQNVSFDHGSSESQTNGVITTITTTPTSSRNKKKRCRQINKRIREALQNQPNMINAPNTLPKHICSDQHECRYVLIKKDSR